MLERICGNVSSLYADILEDECTWAEPPGGKVIDPVVSELADRPHPGTASTIGTWLQSGATVKCPPRTDSSFSAPSVPKQTLKGLPLQARAVSLERQREYLRECFKDCPDSRLRMSMEHSLNTLGMDRASAGPRFGWKNPDRAVDCSGFVNMVYRNAGRPLDATLAKSTGSGTQRMVATLPKIPPNAKPETGDLVFFNTNGPKADGVNHVGILTVDKFGNTGILQNTNHGPRFTSFDDVANDNGETWRDLFKCFRRPSISTTETGRPLL